MQVPHAALVRLTQGAAAEARYRASVENSKKSLLVTRNSNTEGGDGDDDGGVGSCGGGSGGGDSNASGSGSGSGKRTTPLLRFESDQFNLLRFESEKFNDRDKKTNSNSNSLADAPDDDPGALTAEVLPPTRGPVR